MSSSSRSNPPLTSLPEVDEVFKQLSEELLALLAKINKRPNLKTHKNKLLKLYDQFKSQADSLFGLSKQSLAPFNKIFFLKGLEFQAEVITLHKKISDFEANPSLESSYRNKFKEIELEQNNVLLFPDSPNAIPALMTKLNELKKEMETCWTQINLNTKLIWEETMTELRKKHSLFQENHTQKIRQIINNLKYNENPRSTTGDINKLLDQYLKPKETEFKVESPEPTGKKNKRKADKAVDENEISISPSRNISPITLTPLTHIIKNTSISSGLARSLTFGGILCSPSSSSPEEAKTPVINNDVEEEEGQYQNKFKAIKYSCAHFVPSEDLYDPLSQESLETDKEGSQLQQIKSPKQNI